MRGLRSTIALLVVLIGLGAYIYFVTWKKPAEPASKQEKVFVGIDSSKIEELKVASDKGDVTTLKKEGGSWQLVAPLAVKADESEVSGIANALGQLEIVRVRQTQRRQEGVSHPVVPGDNAQPIRVRAARQDGTQVRTRQG